MRQQSHSAKDQEFPILFFDGVCNFCNAWVDFVLSRDKLHFIRFATLQGETAEQKLPVALTKNLESIVFLVGNTSFLYSDAVIEVMKRMGRLYKILGIALGFVPRVIRNAAYKQIAKRRLAFFGKRETCRVPSASERDRFLP